MSSSLFQDAARDHSSRAQQQNAQLTRQAPTTPFAYTPAQAVPGRVQRMLGCAPAIEPCVAAATAARRACMVTVGPWRSFTP